MLKWVIYLSITGDMGTLMSTSAVSGNRNKFKTPCDQKNTYRNDWKLNINISQKFSVLELSQVPVICKILRNVSFLEYEVSGWSKLSQSHYMARI